MDQQAYVILKIPKENTGSMGFAMGVFDSVEAANNYFAQHMRYDERARWYLSEYGLNRIEEKEPYVVKQYRKEDVAW